MAEVSFFVTNELYKSYDKNITGLAGGILFMDHTRQIAIPGLALKGSTWYKLSGSCDPFKNTTCSPCNIILSPTHYRATILIGRARSHHVVAGT